MIDEARPWLPASALTGGPIREGLEATVRSWGERWFVASDARVTDISACPAEVMAGSDAEWRMPGQLVCVSASRTSTQHLLQRALAVSLEGLILTELDRSVTKAFAAKVMDDLAQSIEALLDPVSRGDGMSSQIPVRPNHDALVIQVSDGRTSLLSVAAPFEALVALRKASLSPPQRPAPLSVSLMQALRDQPIRVEAILGSASISLADLDTLARGDVLVLDSVIAEGGALQLADGNQTIGRGGFSEAEGHMALTLTGSN